MTGYYSSSLDERRMERDTLMQFLAPNTSPLDLQLAVCSAAIGLAIVLVIAAFFPGLGAFLMTPVGAIVGLIVFVGFLASVFGEE
jgi:hypothetical protein